MSNTDTNAEGRAPIFSSSSNDEPKSRGPSGSDQGSTSNRPAPPPGLSRSEKREWYRNQNQGRGQQRQSGSKSYNNTNRSRRDVVAHLHLSEAHMARARIIAISIWIGGSLALISLAQFIFLWAVPMVNEKLSTHPTVAQNLFGLWASDILFYLTAVFCAFVSLAMAAKAVSHLFINRGAHLEVGRNDLERLFGKF